MSRTGRLFMLMDALRGYRRPVTAARLAEQLGVSERTIYRDIQTLSGLGAPLQGEAGVGYLLKSGFFLPPLMFGADELAAWCEMRAAFRHFRIDRIASVQSTGERYPRRRHDLLQSWRAEHNIGEDDGIPGRAP